MGRANDSGYVSPGYACSELYYVVLSVDAISEPKSSLLSKQNTTSISYNDKKSPHLACKVVPSLSEKGGLSLCITRGTLGYCRYTDPNYF